MSSPLRGSLLSFALVVVFFLPLYGGAAHAQDETQAQNDETAQAHFRVGRSYYDTGRFEEAAREFERAYELSRRPALLYNVFVSNRDAGNLPAATAALRQYLESVPDAPERPQLQARLATMERLLADRGARADVSTPTPQARSTGSGTASSAGGGGPWTPGFIIAGVGAAAVVVSIVTGVMVLDARAQLDQMCDADGGCPPGFATTRDDAALLAGLTDGLLFGGIAVAATGVVLAFVLSEGEGGQQARAACGLGMCSIRVQF